MSPWLLTTVAGLALFYPVAADAVDIDPEVAIRTYCEPLITGASARHVIEIARQDGLRPEVVGGQPVMRLGELLVGLSDAPRVCFVQAPLAMSWQQGFALVDAWAKRSPGAIRSSATKGPDGAPVRGYQAPARKMAIIATQQTSLSGDKVMNFILMPLSALPRAK